ncbi:MAG: DNA mismatch repair endonuclease MutL [Mycoplasmatota bacterium]
MAVIKQMDTILANKIAAGEVVEKCASVVKELVENSIDAKSTSIQIDLIESGIKEIKITDNGSGMDKEDAIMAFNRHATSKLLEEEDLFRINTLGFRGEALSSIASVSKVDLKTSLGNIGTQVIIEGGILKDVGNSDSRKGTCITISNLFYNTPARLKHLKSAYTELANITDYINKLALANPSIKFKLTNNNATLINTDGSNNLLKTINFIFGYNVAKKMIEIAGENDDYKVSGYISNPEIHKSNRNSMITFVNGRIIKNIDLNRIINDSYSNYKPNNRYPITILNIEVDPSLIDVNIHPTKQDIKFSKSDNLFILIENIIKKVFDKKTLIPKIEDSKSKIYEEQKLEFNFVDESVLEKPVTYEMTNLFEEEIKEEIKTEPKKRFPILQPLGLLHGTYILCQNEEGLYLIDQHAAKERINYELFLEKLSNPSKTKIPLLIPFTYEFSANEFIILKEHFNILENLGFTIEEFGVNSIVIKEHPIWLTTSIIEKQIKKMIETIIEREKNFDLAKLNDHLAATLACKASIKANTSITNEEMNNLISDLEKCDNPFTCPHGRPSIILYTKQEIEKQFKRTGF